MSRKFVKRFVFQSVAAAILLGNSAFVMAQEDGSDDDERGKHRSRGMHHEGMGRGMPDPARVVEMMQRHLDLDEVQSQQLSNIMDAASPEIDALRQGVRANQDAMRALDTNDPDYSVKVQNLSAVNADTASQMTLLHGRLRADINAILTPEQRQLLADRDGRRRGRGRHRDHEEAAL